MTIFIEQVCLLFQNELYWTFVLFYIDFSMKFQNNKKSLNFERYDLELLLAFIVCLLLSYILTLF